MEMYIKLPVLFFLIVKITRTRFFVYIVTFTKSMIFILFPYSFCNHLAYVSAKDSESVMFLSVHLAFSRLLSRTRVVDTCSSYRGRHQ